MEDRIYYVYALLDSSKKGSYIFEHTSFEYEPFYIGMGKGDRIKTTLENRKNSSTYKYNKIRKLKDNNIDIISIYIVQNLTHDDAIAYEILLINEIGRFDMGKGTLTNLTDGGEGFVSLNPETRNKISISQKGEGNGFYGHTHTEEVRKKQSDNVTGTKHPFYAKSHTDETRVIMTEKRKRLSDDMLKEACLHFNKRVIMYDLDMNYIRTYDSVKDAAYDLKTINESIISKCCRGDIKSPTRYFFRYEDLSNNIKINKHLIGDRFLYNGKQCQILKRFSKTTLILDGYNELTIQNDNFKAFDFKDVNDLYFVEFSMFLRKISSSFKIDYNNYIVYNDTYTFYYYKLYKNSEIFKNKSDIYNSKRENTYHVYEDIFVKKTNIVKSRVKNIIYDTSNRIYARKCELYYPSFKECKEFLIENHIQGFVIHKYAIGLKYNGEMVSLMTFGNLRKNLGTESKEGHFEMLRFCSKLNHSVIGGASKIFKHFIYKYDPMCVISYADCSLSNGNLYKKLGFEFVNRTIPNYYYIIDNYNKENRFKHRKDILVKNGGDVNKTEIEIQHSKGLYRIWDLGSYKFVYNKK